MKIALIAHDKKKMEMIVFCKDYEHVLEKYELYATGTTGKKIMENTNLEIKRMKSGPLGGDQDIGAMIANGNMDMVFFFRDPLTAQPHEPDVSALMRLSDVYEIPIATNKESAKFFIDSI
jgi:methylglyoxal synthase